jgi:hypothetical protein
MGANKARSASKSQGVTSTIVTTPEFLLHHTSGDLFSDWLRRHNFENLGQDFTSTWFVATRGNIFYNFFFNCYLNSNVQPVYFAEPLYKKFLQSERIEGTYNLIVKVEVQYDDSGKLQFANTPTLTSIENGKLFELPSFSKVAENYVCSRPEIFFNGVGIALELLVTSIGLENLYIASCEYSAPHILKSQNDGPWRAFFVQVSCMDSNEEPDFEMLKGIFEWCQNHKHKFGCFPYFADIKFHKTPSFNLRRSEFIKTWPPHTATFYNIEGCTEDEIHLLQGNGNERYIRRPREKAKMRTPIKQNVLTIEKTEALLALKKIELNNLLKRKKSS